MPSGFRPPKPHPLVLTLCRIATRPALLLLYGIVGIEYRREDLDLLASMRGERVLFVPNHPTNAEPAVMFHLGQRLRQRFLFVSNREAFDRAFGLFGKLLQGCGAYSIIRGAPDRESFKFTRKLLGEPRTKLVIFPEGEVYSQNDTLLPFHEGVFHLALGAADDLSEGETLTVMPVALKYRYLGDANWQINYSLYRLERALGVKHQPQASRYDRMVACADQLLASAEAAYHLKPAKGQIGPGIFQARIDAVREAIVDRVAEGLGTSPGDRNRPLHERMRSLYHALYSVTSGEIEPDTPYEARLAQEEQRRIRPLFDDMRRLANWVAIRDSYVAEHPSVERFIDTLRRMEAEVFGKVRMRMRKRCLVRLGDPFELTARLGQYRTERKAAVAELTDEAEGAVQAVLDALQ
ncbi:MAG: 1-acyl-sn-glycerol-3-phosphate acyltransferase [Fimbriimonadaceae bacterium]|nr:1-acyl-sn-glycerol-3-phosphate acyltransferase [Fimbriimonadaceae bacterium]